MGVQSPTSPVTLLPASSSASSAAAVASSSSATSRFTRWRSQRVAAPGPGPSSSISSPSSTAATRGTRTSDSRYSAHSWLEHRSAWFPFIVRVTLAPPSRFRKPVACQLVSPDGHVARAAIVATFPMPVGTLFEWHHHRDHQLAWSPEGVLVVRTHGGSYVLPPTRALWIPA